jgi:murein DD-endopeptidase MepM/ murein hydrolase activator NlpD
VFLLELFVSDSILAGNLLWPISCQPNDLVCSNIGYPDIDGDGKAFNCGPPGYTGHQGTDIPVRSWTTMDSGVSVFAAADGEVIWVFDGKYDKCPNAGEPDCQSPPNGWSEPGKSNGYRVCTDIGPYCGIGDYGCFWCFDGGNVVVIKHNDLNGVFATRYDHLKAGSIKVAPGDVVTKGQIIAEVGSAGNSTGPHLHFEVWGTGFYQLADPWAGSCGPNFDHSLWENDPPYANSVALTVHKSGAGSGTVTSNPMGINCGSDCTEYYSTNTSITMMATAASGSTFAGWSGACTGTGTCQVTMSVAKSVTASFAKQVVVPQDNMSLRDAVYLYNQPLNGKGDKVLVGVDCDVFELALDVTSGYTNLAMGQADTLVQALASQGAYADRIQDTDAMFAYALYENKPVKTFAFNSQSTPQPSSQIGAATVFGYCYSSNPNAHVYFHQKDVCTNTYSDGHTTSCNSADNGNGGSTDTGMRLRDAIYLYGQDVNGRGSKILAGENCDVFQLLLDVNSGYTDLAMAQQGTVNDVVPNQVLYPDRITDSAAMFSYALYDPQPVKAFVFGDRDNPLSSTKLGTNTIFGYCYSTNQDAKVYFRELDKCTDKSAGGLTYPIQGCVQ